MTPFDQFCDGTRVSTRVNHQIKRKFQKHLFFIRSKTKQSEMDQPIPKPFVSYLRSSLEHCQDAPEQPGRLARCLGTGVRNVQDFIWMWTWLTGFVWHILSSLRQHRGFGRLWFVTVESKIPAALVAAAIWFLVSTQHWSAHLSLRQLVFNFLHWHMQNPQLDLTYFWSWTKDIFGVNHVIVSESDTSSTVRPEWLQNKTMPNPMFLVAPQDDLELSI